MEMTSNDLIRQGQYSTQELDELQRGHETAPSMETLEGVAPPIHGQRREIPIPHPGERPNAVRADHAQRVADTAEMERVPTEEGGIHDVADQDDE
jgi:hypothetical protein